MQFGILGPLAVSTAAGESVRVPERKVRTLLATLLIDAGAPVSPDRLIEHLWGTHPPARAANTLQTKVSQLRKLLEAHPPWGRDRVAFSAAGYTLRVEPESVDAQRFAMLTAQARRAADPAAKARLLQQALELWRGPALADFRDEPFAQPVIARLEEDRLAAMEELAEARLELGEHAVLIGALADLVAQHPLRERLRAAHMRALYRAGRQTEALESYRQLRERLSSELGLDPSPQLATLQQEVLAHADALELPSPRHVARGNVPTPLTEIIGREQTLDQLQQALAAGRLVTLIGPGGVGKTRLAVATAHHPGTVRPPDGAWFVELGALQPADEQTAPSGDVADLIAAALDIRDSPPRAGKAANPPRTIDRLVATVRDSHMLLILDNCEHVVEQVAETAQRLLADAPGLRIMATSREALGVSGEVILPVPPLELPSPVVTDPGVLAGFSAAQLFAARAAAAKPGFEITELNAAAVATICRRLDGIPLALELAASRVRALDVRTLADRLDDRFRLLSAGKRGVPARQRTLRAVIDWSWELLSAPEQAVLRRLAVHADGCTVSTAEAVCAGRDVPAEEVLGILIRLVDRSLVVASGSDETRYSLLESVAAYGMERLADAAETDQVRRRHARHFAALAEQAEPHLRGPGQGGWLEQLDAESNNLRRALDFAVADTDATLSLRLANALAWYWFLRGRPREAARSLARALSVPGPAPQEATARARAWHAAMVMLGEARRDEPNTAALELFEEADDPSGLANAQWILAHAEFGYGELEASERLTSLALAGFHKLDDQWGVAACLALAASQAIFRGNLDAIREYSEQSLTLFEHVGDGWGRLQALEALGTYHEITGGYAEADQLFRAGRQIAEDLELWTELSWTVSRLGRIALLSGDLARADRLHEEGHEIATQHSNIPGQEFADIGLAISARQQGRLDEAERRLRRWLEWNRKVEAEYGVTLILSQLGFVAEHRGDPDTARALHHEALQAASITGDTRARALALEGLAGAESLAGEYVLAARLLGAADAARQSVGAPLPAGERFDVDRIERRIQGAMGEAAFSAAFREGTTLDAAAQPPSR